MQLIGTDILKDTKKASRIVSKEYAQTGTAESLIRHGLGLVSLCRRQFVEEQALHIKH